MSVAVVVGVVVAVGVGVVVGVGAAVVVVMTTPNDLLKLSRAATPGPWTTKGDLIEANGEPFPVAKIYGYGRFNRKHSKVAGDLALIAALRNLAESLAELWEAVDTQDTEDCYAMSPRVKLALTALAAQEKEPVKNWGRIQAECRYFHGKTKGFICTKCGWSYTETAQEQEPKP